MLSNMTACSTVLCLGAAISLCTAASVRAQGGGEKWQNRTRL